ncbi:3-oxoacyl-ACP synthase [Synergistales bacterium]|nr:3-oxoacyl-ACP synthase [Synergistales bacterium]
MLISKYEGIRIAGIAAAVPDNVRRAEEYYDQFGQNKVKNFVNVTGVKERRTALKNQTSSDLAYEAASRLLREKDVNIKEIGALVFVTQTPDYIFPASACVLHTRLGLSTDCMAFDVNLGCSAYVYGLNIVSSLMQSSNITKALLLSGDTLDRYVSPEDRSAAMLMGDAGTATLLEKGSKTGAQNSIIGSFRTDGSRFKAIIIPCGLNRNADAPAEREKWGDGNIRSDHDFYMNGMDVLSFTITEVPELTNEFLSEINKSVDDYDFFILHQANEYIIKQVAERIKAPIDKVPISLDRYGNTSGESIPLTLCDAFGKREQGNVNVLLCGFGVGLSWGVVSTLVNAEDILPIIETSEYFTGGSVPRD